MHRAVGSTSLLLKPVPAATLSISYIGYVYGCLGVFLFFVYYFRFQGCVCLFDGWANGFMVQKGTAGWAMRMGIHSRCAAILFPVILFWSLYCFFGLSLRVFTLFILIPAHA